MRDHRSHLALALEIALAGLVLAGGLALIMSFNSLGYLPSPFYHDKSDTLMDWYNTAYWSHREGAYSNWRAIYPPLTFDLLRLISPARCYVATPSAARGCDPSGSLIAGASVALDAALLIVALRRAVGRSAWPRSAAMIAGVSVLYGVERGNVVLPTFALFILAYGDLIRGPWGRALAEGLMVNLKPYLIITPIVRLLRRDWRAFARVAVAGGAVYLISAVLLHAGGPITLVRNAAGFALAPMDPRYGLFQFTTTYDSLLAELNASDVARRSLGSAGVAAVRLLAPLAMALGAGGALACLFLASRRPSLITTGRAMALGLSLMFVFACPGAYALVFMLFFVFQERWESPGQILALVAAYLWSIPFDVSLIGVTREIDFSYLAGHRVVVDLPLTVGQLTRPALVLVMQYGLVGATFQDLMRHARVKSNRRSNLKGER
jgi:hypothetical protein